MKKNLMFFLKRFGQKSFADFPFNEVDSLLLCQLSYLNWMGYVPNLVEPKPAVNLSDLIIDDLVIYKVAEDTIDEAANRKLLMALRKCSRYEHLQLQYHRNRFDPGNSEQFSATTFLFDDFAYLAFRGTDPTFIGWKEDFNMSFMDTIPAQEEAKQYLETVADRLTLPFYVGGHSKGGNLTYYAVLQCRKDLRDRIITIYNHDGPGFKRDIFTSEDYQLLEAKMVKMIPHDSIVGVIMHHSDRFEVVRCYGVSLLQHDLFMWRVNKAGRLDTIKDNSLHSQVFDIAIREWIDQIEEQERIRFVNALFNLLGAVGNVNVFDIKKHPFVYMRSVRKRYKRLSPEERSLIKNTFEEYQAISKRVHRKLKEEAKQKKHEMRG